MFVRPTGSKTLRLTRQAPLHGAVARTSGYPVAQRYFGPRPHPALLNRLGDYTLFAVPGHALLYPPAQAKDKKLMPGNHGGLSADELDVPLFVVPC